MVNRVIIVNSFFMMGMVKIGVKYAPLTEMGLVRTNLHCGIFCSRFDYNTPFTAEGTSIFSEPGCILTRNSTAGSIDSPST